jgi:Flp pilus assembly pilin Flp
MIETVITGARAIFRRFQSRNGQSLAEYALILSFISLLTVAVNSILGFQLRGVFTAILHALAAARTSI